MKLTAEETMNPSKTTQSFMKNIVVLYHGNCSDGFSGAWAAWKKLGNRASYIPLYHNEQPPAGLIDKEIIFIDFAYPYEIMKKIAKQNIRLTVLDHHITRRDAIKAAHSYMYALNHSGAALAWRYFHPKKPMPRFLQHVEDIDLWKFSLHDTKAIMAFTDSIPFDFKKWDALVEKLEAKETRREIIEKGKFLLQYQDAFIERLVKENAEPVTFLGYNILAINWANISSKDMHSQLGNALCKKVPPFSVVWGRAQGKIHVDLRSNGKVDVSKIAERFGGGGHKSAAGFDLAAHGKFPWKPLKLSSK